MNSAEILCNAWRGPLVESLHYGHAVISNDAGQIVKSWGDPQAVVYPRSSSKMIQALPLITSGAADRFGLSAQQLALACASHNGAAIHTERVQTWLRDLGMGDDDFRCGPQMPRDPAAKLHLIKTDQSPCQMHNNCSGKHCGFLTLNKHLGAGPEYIDPDHPVQIACLEAFETVTDHTSPAFGIDGCSAPNHATTIQAMARAMAWFASSADRTDTMSQAAWRLTQAMIQYPELVAGEDRACTDLMRAAKGRVALKTGAEAYFVAIIPERKLGIALKIIDGATRASECAIAAILVDLGILDPADPIVQKYLNAPVKNWRGVLCGKITPADGLFA